jgi:uncharacterized protein YndB with AHSA1/START domain
MTPKKTKKISTKSSKPTPRKLAKTPSRTSPGTSSNTLPNTLNGSLSGGFDKIGRVSSASVFKATQKSWAEWVSLLDKAGARTWTHQEIVAYLKKRYKLGPWWQQGVTGGYEMAIGRRGEGQNTKGEFTITATKSLPVAAKKVWKFLVSDSGQAIWLKPLYLATIEAGQSFETSDGYFGEIRTIKKEHRIRMTWQDPDWTSKTVVHVTLFPRPGEKSILVIDHTQIKDLRVEAKMRKRWRDSIDELAGFILKPNLSSRRD